MDANLILNELVNIRKICLTSETLEAASIQTNLLILKGDGYSILSYEFADYLSKKYSQEFPLDELHSLLPNIIKKFGTRIEPMHSVKDLSFSYYEIFLT